MNIVTMDETQVLRHKHFMRKSKALRHNLLRRKRQKSQDKSLLVKTDLSLDAVRERKSA